MDALRSPPIEPTVYTVGHSNHPIDQFIQLLNRNGITAIADVRSNPYSRYQPQFNREELKRALRSAGIDYVFLGNELGARSPDPSCYVGGRVQYSRLAAAESFKAGLDRVVKGSQSRHIALMCAEKEPLECHRTLLVGQALHGIGVPLTHIHANGDQEPHELALMRLLDITGLPQEDMFRSRDELLAEALRIQEQRVAYVDEQMASGRDKEQR